MDTATSGSPLTCAPRSTPRLADIRPADLADPARAAELHRQAVAAGRITASEADRQRFDAAVAHARRCGTRNAPGLLAWMLRGNWSVISQADEDAARRRQAPPRPVATGPRPAPPPAIASPYGAEVREQAPSALADILARLAR